jgi:xylulokinase
MSPLRPAILWNDQRTAAQCDAIEGAFGGRESSVRMVGNAPLTGFTLPKLLWVRDNEPDLWARASTFMLPKDYLRWVMTGVIATDVGDASGTLLFDPARRSWSLHAAASVQIPAHFLPPVLESGDVGGHLSPWAAAQLGLPSGIPVIAGSGDNMMGAVGAGIVQPGDAVITIGTSGVVYTHVDQPLLDVPTPGQADPAGRFHSMCAANGNARQTGDWCVTGCTLSAGGSLAWAKEQLWPDVSYDVLLQEAVDAPAGCDGLSFLPYLTGERCPYPDPRARGGWIGLTARHRRGHLVRAVLEGVACALAEVADLQRSRGVSMKRIFVGGGGMKAPLWRQMVCDMVASPLLIPNTEEGPAFGGALLALAAVGGEPIPALLHEIVREEGRVEPRMPDSGYANVRSRQRDLYTALRDSFHQMA